MPPPLPLKHAEVLQAPCHASQGIPVKIATCRAHSPKGQMRRLRLYVYGQTHMCRVLMTSSRFDDVIGLMGSGVPHCFEWRACASDLAPSGSTSESDRHNGLLFCSSANYYNRFKVDCHWHATQPSVAWLFKGKAYICQSTTEYVNARQGAVMGS